MMHVIQNQAEPLPTITGMIVKAAVVRNQEMREKLEAAERAKEADASADSKKEAAPKQDIEKVEPADNNGLGKTVDVLA
ncbi:MAG: hypothetical protein HQ504_08005 [Rhodospirillaceae bacterium]|nr:hypothetical protein [Rhodospirillaceae bacterium]